jgi:hypothetical protein
LSHHDRLTSCRAGKMSPSSTRRPDAISPSCPRNSILVPPVQPMPSCPPAGSTTARPPLGLGELERGANPLPGGVADARLEIGEVRSGREHRVDRAAGRGEYRAHERVVLVEPVDVPGGGFLVRVHEPQVWRRAPAGSPPRRRRSPGLGRRRHRGRPGSPPCAAPSRPGPACGSAAPDPGRTGPEHVIAPTRVAATGDAASIRH